MKTVIVTGASRGIGKAIALRLSKDGYRVIVNYLEGRSEAEEVVKEIMAINGEALAIQGNVAKFVEMENLFEETRKHFGEIYAVVNNAGVSQTRMLSESDDEIYNHIFDVNVRGTLNVLRLSSQYLTSGGRIVTFSTTAIISARPGLGIYIASKAAVEAMSRVLANELRGKNITVNSVAPGLISSEMFFSDKTTEQIKQLEKASPLERFGDVEEIANVVSFLIGKDASWVNGQNIRVNGGVG